MVRRRDATPLGTSSCPLYPKLIKVTKWTYSSPILGHSDEDELDEESVSPSSAQAEIGAKCFINLRLVRALRLPLSTRGARNCARRSFFLIIRKTSVKLYSGQGAASRVIMRSCSTKEDFIASRRGERIWLRRLNAASTMASLEVSAITIRRKVVHVGE